MTPTEFKSARKRLGLSIKDMAEALRVHKRTIRKWEDGKYTDVPAAAAIAARYMVRDGPELAFSELPDRDWPPNTPGPMMVAFEYMLRDA